VVSWLRWAQGVLFGPATNQAFSPPAAGQALQSSTVGKHFFFFSRHFYLSAIINVFI
jgi:hypothetical protein